MTRPGPLEGHPRRRSTGRRAEIVSSDWGCERAASASSSDSSNRAKAASTIATYMITAGGIGPAGSASGLSQPSTTSSRASMPPVANRESTSTERASQSARGFGPILEPADRVSKRLDRLDVVADGPLELPGDGPDGRQGAGIGRQQREPAPHQAGRGLDQDGALLLDRSDRFRPALCLEPVLDRIDCLALLVDRPSDRTVQPAAFVLSQLFIEALQQEFPQQRVEGEVFLAADPAHEHAGALEGALRIPLADPAR